MTQKSVVFKTNAPFMTCVSKISNTFIYNPEDLDFVMQIYNRWENSDNYSMTSRSLSNYYRDEVDDIRDNASDGKSFDYKAKYQENQKEDLQPGNAGHVDPPARAPVPKLRVETTIPLNYLSNLLRSLTLL